MSNFQDRWISKKKEEPLGEKVRESILPQAPLRNRILSVQQSLNREISKLDNVEIKLRKKDAQMMHKVVTAMDKHDEQYAAARANELAETRKMGQMANQSKMVLEQISLRLGSIQDLGDVVTVLAPIVPVIKGIKGGLSGIIPNAGSSIDEIGDSLNDLMMSAGTMSGSTLNFEASSEDAQHIISEATAVAEQKKMNKLPPVPTNDISSLQTNPDFSL